MHHLHSDWLLAKRMRGREVKAAYGGREEGRTQEAQVGAVGPGDTFLSASGAAVLRAVSHPAAQGGRGNRLRSELRPSKELLRCH